MSARAVEAGRICRVRQVLAVDGLGCAAAAAALLASGRMSRAVLPNSGQRSAVVTALGATSLALLAGAAAAQRRHWSLRGAALVNLGWVAACLKALTHRPSFYGSVLLAGTAAFDAVAGTLQWTLQKQNDQMPCEGTADT